MGQWFISKIGLSLTQLLMKDRAWYRPFLPLHPVSREFGADRGQPIDRYYIEHFLSKYRQDITGDVLEIEQSIYTRRFGQDVRSAQTLHVNRKVTPETIVGDLSKPELLPENRFDCFICTQTFQYIYDIDQGVEGTYRLLKPGGVLLATMPTVSPRSVAETESWQEYWRLTSDAAARAFGNVYGPENVHVEAYGNVLVAVAFLLGLARQDLPQQKLDFYDPDYQCVVTVRAKKVLLP